MSQQVNDKKEVALEFLSLISQGEIKRAFQKYLHPEFVLHNSLAENNEGSLLSEIDSFQPKITFKKYESNQVFDDGKLVVVHGKLHSISGRKFVLIHIFKFYEHRIIESWEMSSEIVKYYPTQN